MQLSLPSSLEHFHHPQRHRVPVSSHSPSPSPSSWRPHIYLLSLWICLFWTLPIKRIVHGVAFCVQLLSLGIMFARLTHIVADVTASSSSGPNRSPLWALGRFYLSIDGHLGFSRFWPSLSNAAITTRRLVHLIQIRYRSNLDVQYRFLCGCVLSFLWGRYPGA